LRSPITLLAVWVCDRFGLSAADGDTLMLIAAERPCIALGLPNSALRKTLCHKVSLSR